jgi:hypothetical protein
MKTQNLTPWPSRHPIGAMTATLLAIATSIGFAWAQILLTWTPLQRYYIADLSAHTVAVTFNERFSPHRLVLVVDRQGKWYYARNSDFVAGHMMGTDGTNFPFKLSDDAKDAGFTGALLSDRSPYETARLGPWFQRTVYAGLSRREFVKIPLAAGLVTLIAGLWLTTPWDRRRNLVRKYGRRLRGPEYVSAKVFVQRLHADGVGFIHGKGDSIDRPAAKSRLSLRIPTVAESSGIMICGDPGSGKSSIVQQLLLQIEARDECAIVYDPALEFTSRFFNPERGDIILNPFDARSPYWDLAAEVSHDAEARTLASSVLPPHKEVNPFFTDAAQRTLAHLLRHRPSAAELSSWLCNPAEIDRRVRGTEIASMIDSQGGPQRAGVLGSLAMFGDALRMLPSRDDTKATWSSTAWAKERKGWIFITSRPTMREQLRPLISTWLDQLILRLMSEANSGTKKTWFILDELASLQHLPQLKTALTENRKSGNPIVIAFQGKSQVETIYGPIAETMLSVLATKIFFRTSEPNSAKWISQAIGNVEYEQLRESESVNPNQGRSRSEQTDFVTRPLVMAEEIAGLARLNGFIKYVNLVADLHTRFVSLPDYHPGFIPRSSSHGPMPTSQLAPSDDDKSPHANPGGAHARLIFE